MEKNNFWQKLKKPFFVLAPMEDVTDFVFREILAEIAPPDVFFTEFTNADGLISAGKTEVLKRLKYSEKQRPIVAQIWGNNPQSMKEAAKIVQDLGFDGVDINMGCPDKSVVKIGAGSALIENPDLAKELIEETRLGAPNIPLSIKTRIGFNNPKTQEWANFLLKLGIDCLIIHGRTKKQMSKVPANWEEIKKAVVLRNELGVKSLVVGNGDILSYQSGLQKHLEYSVDGIMVGRGILANPWFFAPLQLRSAQGEINLPSHSIAEKLNLLLKHANLFEQTWGKTKNFAIMKKFFKIYAKDFEGAVQLRENLMKCENYAEVEKIILEALRKL